MAEIVGTVAAVVQFVDVALRLSSCLERFCSDVRNVPRRFLQLKSDLRQQIEIAQHIRNHNLPSFATTVSSSTFDTPLVEYINLAEELCKTLEGLLARKNDGVLQRGWDALCSVRKKEEVASICDRLEQKKSTLSLWLDAANLKLTSSVAATTDQTRLDVGQALSLIKTIDSTSNKLATDTTQLLPHVEEIDRNLATTTTRTERILQDTERLLSGYDAGIISRESIRQSTEMALANTEQIIAAIERLTVSPGNHSPHGGGGYVMGRTHVGSSASQQVQQITVDRGRRPRRCKCRTVSTARRWQPLSILRFTRTFRTQHFSYCPDYQYSEQSLEITMQIVPPSWLLCSTIDFGTHVKNWSTRKNISISPVVIGTSRLVDRDSSLAFRAITECLNELVSLSWKNARQHHVLIPELQCTLQRLFEDGKASVIDTDSNGHTVLNKIVRLFVFDCGSACEVTQYTALFRFLLDKGANPNIVKDTTPEVTFQGLTHHGGTTCDQLMDPMLFYMDFNGSAYQGLRTILELLSESGGHTSKPFVGYRSPALRVITFRAEVTQLSLFEDQIDIMDLGDVVPIILQQKEEHLRHIIRKAKLSTLNRKSPVNGLAPVHFAVLWPIGLRILVNRGVDVNIEDDYGRRPIHLAVASGIPDSVRCLLNADCGLFTPAEDHSLLQYALNLDDDQEWLSISFHLVQALSDRHTRIRNLAKSCLPPSIFSTLGLAPHGLQEQRASSITEKLLSHGIDVPSALELDGKGLYDIHWTNNLSLQVTPEVATALWCAGFHDIDEPNNNGWTPFLQSWFCHNFEMINWFTKKGIRLDSKHAEAPLTALHLYAKRLGSYKAASRQEDVDTSALKQHYIGMIQQQLGIPYDDCTCACSPNGCTPAKFLLEKDSPQHQHSYKDRIRTWTSDTKPSTALSSRYIYQFTRLVLFDFLGGEHTCCSLGQSYSTFWYLQKPAKAMTWWKRFTMDYNVRNSQNVKEHLQCCMNGLLVPRSGSLEGLQDPDIFSATFASAMSHYDKMNRPDTMPAEQQVFAYINWILEEGYLDIDVSNGCEHNDGTIRRCERPRW